MKYRRRKMNYTKGDWEQLGTTIVAPGKDGAIICKMAKPHPVSGMIEFAPLDLGDEGWDLQMDNARLIAAAPDMYEALRTITEALHNGEITRAVRYSQEIATLILAKAEGKEMQ